MRRGLQFSVRFTAHGTRRVPAPTAHERDIMTRIAPSCGLCSVVALVLFSPQFAKSQEETAVAEAPPGTDVLETTFEGTWFVSRELKQQFDGLIERVRGLEERVRGGELPAWEARAELEELRSQLADVRKLLDAEKVLVNPFTIHDQVEEGTFELGPERLLVVTGDRLRVIGWDEPHVKYELRRIVLSAGESADEDLQGILLEHNQGLAPELVGETAEQRQAGEQTFLNSEVGRKLTPEQRANRARLVEQIASDYRHFAQFQGRSVDSLRVFGLTYEEGNRQISYELNRPEGGRQMGSRWRRHAELTLYVPRCTAILLRGCQAAVDVSGVEGHLILTDSGSGDRDYNGRFAVRALNGALTLDNVPMDVIEDVSGDVFIESTTEMVNTGTTHTDGFRTAYTPAPRRCSIAGVAGNLTAHFIRSDLHLAGIAGVVDVENDYGDTDWSVARDPAEGAHRVVSHSGLVRAVLSPDILPPLPLYAATNCGTLRTSFNRDVLDDLSVAHTSAHNGKRRDWQVFHSPVDNHDFTARFALYDRGDKAFFDDNRTPGIDLISRAGRVELLRGDASAAGRP